MAAQSSTYSEYVGEGYYVIIQHCEFIDSDGVVCDEYLGAQYPSLYCLKHR